MPESLDSLLNHSQGTVLLLYSLQIWWPSILIFIVPINEIIAQLLLMRIIARKCSLAGWNWNKSC
jgi:hypothetical protein